MSIDGRGKKRSKTGEEEDIPAIFHIWFEEVCISLAPHDQSHVLKQYPLCCLYCEICLIPNFQMRYLRFPY